METKTQKTKAYLLDIILSSPIGTKIPSERELMSHLNYSRPTVQNAIDALINEGYLYRVERQGTFIAQNRLCATLNHLSSFNEEARNLGVTPITQVIESSVLTADSYLSEKMNIPIGEKIYYFLRLRKHANTPICLDYSFYASFAVSHISTRVAEGSIYNYIENVKKLSISSSISTIEALLPEDEIAQLLCVEKTEPLLLIERLSRLNDGRIFEHTISYVVSKHYKIAINSIR